MLPLRGKQSKVHLWSVFSHLDPLTVEADGGDGVEELVELHHVQGGGLTSAIKTWTVRIIISHVHAFRLKPIMMTWM